MARFQKGHAPFGRALKGHIVTKETLRKMSESRKGIPGKPHSAETKRRMSEIQKGKKLTEFHRRNLSDAVSLSYKNGRKPWNYGMKSESTDKYIRESLEYKLWRKSVWERDHYKCIWCGSNKKIEADHIKKFAHYPELRFAIDNGRTLCQDCHKTTDTYGNKGKRP